MKVYSDISLKNFDAWAGAVDTIETLTADELNSIEAILDDAYPDGINETELNDFLWFEKDTIADWLGYEDWEQLEKDRD